MMLAHLSPPPPSSPLARKVALATGVNLADVKGSGHRGKIMRSDVEKHALTPKVNVSRVAHDVSTQSTKHKLDNADNELELIPMSPMRKVIARRMSESYLLAPSVVLNYDVDMSSMIELRAKLLKPIMDKTGEKLTFTDLIALCVIKNLIKDEHKFINASLNKEATEITIHKYVNLALAVGLDGGLVTPVAFHADKMNLSELVVTLKDLAKRATSGKLKLSELTGSTFTISNLGMFGVSTFTAIINQPNSAILGISSTIKKAVAIDDEITIRPMMSLSLTIDHRVIDGMAGAKFMQDIKKTMEDPIALFI